MTEEEESDAAAEPYQPYLQPANPVTVTAELREVWLQKIGPGSWGETVRVGSGQGKGGYDLVLGPTQEKNASTLGYWRGAVSEVVVACTKNDGMCLVVLRSVRHVQQQQREARAAPKTK